MTSVFIEIVYIV